MARTKESKMFRGKHLQHTSKFIKECNSVLVKHLDAFRTYDEVWIIGKYKGIKLIDTPINYIKWAYNNMNLSSNSKSILKKYFDS
jgi:hypothetical protein